MKPFDLRFFAVRHRQEGVCFGGPPFCSGFLVYLFSRGYELGFVTTGSGRALGLCWVLAAALPWMGEIGPREWLLQKR